MWRLATPQNLAKAKIVFISLLSAYSSDVLQHQIQDTTNELKPHVTQQTLRYVSKAPAAFDVTSTRATSARLARNTPLHPSVPLS